MRRDDRRRPMGPLIITVSRLGTLASGLVTAPVVARALGPEGRGLLSGALAAIAVAPILLGLGLPMAVRRQASLGDPGPVLRTARILTAALLAPAALLGLAVGRWLLPGLSSIEAVLLTSGIVAAPFVVSALIDQSLLIVRQRYGQVAVLQLAQPGSYFLLVLAGWLTGRLDLAWLLGAQCVALLIAGSTGAALVRVGVRGPRSPYRPLLREGLRYAGGQLAETAQNRLDQVVMVPLIGAAQAGIYAVAVTIGVLPLAIGHALVAARFKDIAASVGSARAGLSAATVRAALVLTLLSAAGLAAVTPLAIPFLFGPDFRPSVVPTLIALVGSTAMVGGYVANSLLAARGRGRSMTSAQLSGLACGLAALVVLGPALRADGAAAASTLGYVVGCALAVRSLHLPGGSLTLRRSDLRAALEMIGVTRRAAAP